MGLFELPGDALEDLLDRERGAILAGRFDVLERLMSEKERLFAAVLRRPENTIQLARLKDMVQRNGTLLSAMENGVRAAARRIKGLGRPGPDLKTYDASGGRQVITDTRHALQRRA